MNFVPVKYGVNWRGDDRWGNESKSVGWSWKVNEMEKTMIYFYLWEDIQGTMFRTFVKRYRGPHNLKSENII